MAILDASSARFAAGPVLVALALACTATPTPDAAVPPAAPDAVPKAASEAVPSPPPPPSDFDPPPVDPPREPRRQPRQTTIVIDPGTESERPPTLLEASRAAREGKRTAGPPMAVINDDNLSDYADRGRLTLARPDPVEAQNEAEGEAGAGAEPGEPSRDETYWRDGVRRLRELWRTALDETAELEERAEGLRQRFYAEDDLYLRDSRIKPAWDRVLDRLQRVRSDADLYRTELDGFLEQGRQEGALPGWLREGIELEPEPERPSTDLPEHEPGEPEIMGDGYGGGGEPA